MALSNWDTLAFGPDGKPSSGDYTTGNTTVSIYKNWVYIYNPELWKKGYDFSNPCIAEIISGCVRIAGVQVIAHRHTAQDAVFVLVSHQDSCASWPCQEKFSGIGCYGYADDPASDKYVGVKPETYKAFLEWLEKEAASYARVVQSHTPARYNQGDVVLLNHCSTSEPGKAVQPVFEDLIKKI